MGLELLVLRVEIEVMDGSVEVVGKAAGPSPAGASWLGSWPYASFYARGRLGSDRPGGLSYYLSKVMVDSPEYLW